MKEIPKWVHDALNAYELHKEKIEEYGQNNAGFQVDDSQWSIRKTARVFNISVRECHSRIKLGAALKKNKQLAYSSSRAAALRLIGR